MYDAIIVGARCAGSATGLLLARRGLRVLLLDRATFPSDTISGHFIMHPGTRKLAEWGLLERVIASGAPPINHASYNAGDFTLSATLTPEDGATACIGARRTALDANLIQAALQAGAELREGCSVRQLVWEGNRVTGVRCRTLSGKNVAERTRLVIGADGRHSLVARLVDAPSYGVVPPLTCWYMSYWADLPVEGLELHWLDNRVALVFPTNHGLSLVAVGWPHDEFRAVRADIDGNHHAVVGSMPALAGRFRQARRVEPYTGMADLTNFFRRPYGAGWALVGDAGHFKDPTPARGISDAFLDAELLAEAVAAGLGGGTSLADTLPVYEERRNERAIPDSEFVIQRADLSTWGAPEQLALRAALRHSPGDTREYLQAIAGVIPRERFFAPENIGRIMAAARATAKAG